MLIRHVNNIKGGEREVNGATWTSLRLLIKDDGMGFSLHETTMAAGSRTHMCYRNHLEAVFCIAGEGELEVLPSGQRFHINPGLMYALDQHDEHCLHALSELKLICVFNPPVTGREVHDETGAYPLPD